MKTTSTEYRLERTNSNNFNFIQLVEKLDKYLAEVFGVQQEYYDRFNLINDNDTVVVAYINKIPVGCGCLRRYTDDSVEIKRMFVAHEYRGHGIATAILSELEKWAQELGYKHIILETGTLLTEANKFYKKHNYHITEKWGQYTGVETSVCMKKTIV